MEMGAHNLKTEAILFLPNLKSNKTGMEIEYQIKSVLYLNFMSSV